MAFKRWKFFCKIKNPNFWIFLTLRDLEKLQIGLSIGYLENPCWWNDFITEIWNTRINYGYAVLGKEHSGRKEHEVPSSGKWQNLRQSEPMR